VNFKAVDNRGLRQPTHNAVHCAGSRERNSTVGRRDTINIMTQNEQRWLISPSDSLLDTIILRDQIPALRFRQSDRPACVCVAPCGYPLVGGTRQRPFAGTNFKPRKQLENAAHPTTTVLALFQGSGARCVGRR
jgi:hypothetical protein